MFVLKRLDNPFLSNLNKIKIISNKKKTMNFNDGIQERSNQSNESFEKKKLGNFSFMSNDEIFF